MKNEIYNRVEKGYDSLTIEKLQSINSRPSVLEITVPTEEMAQALRQTLPALVGK